MSKKTASHRTNLKSSVGNNVVEAKFIDTVSRMGMSMGLNRIVGQIYGLLYFRNKPLSLDDISEALKVSKGNVSVNIRELENWGAVKTVWVPGSRKDYYEANMDVVGVIYKRMRLRLEKMLSELDNNIAAWKNSSDIPDEFGERIKEIERLKNILDNVIKILPQDISGYNLINKIGLLAKLKSML